MHLLIQVIAIVVAIAAVPATVSYSISRPVYKQFTRTDDPKPLYTTIVCLNSGNSLPYSDVSLQQTMALDLDAPFTWHYAWPRQESCQGCAKTVRCDATQCADLRTTFSYQSPLCTPPIDDPSYEDTFGACGLCAVNVINPVTGACTQDVYAVYDDITFSTYEVATSSYTIYPVTGLASRDDFQAFPTDVLGVLALSTSAYAVPAALNNYINRIVALCLPSSRPPPGIGTTNGYYGLLTFGDGPYSLDVDIKSFLSYTPLVKNPNSFGYFIGVDDIIIKNRSTGVPANTTAKISTIEPYTKLRTDIYNNVIRRVLKVTKRIPQAKPVTPFGLCFNTTVNGTNVGIKVANIDLVLQDGKKWTISTTNSITQVADGVACLAVVDGGAKAEHAIVIGTYQLEDNLVVFDTEKSRFGFYSLLRRGSACIDFQV